MDLVPLFKEVGFISGFWLPVTFIHDIQTQDDDMEIMANYNLDPVENSQDDFEYSQNNTDDTDYEPSQKNDDDDEQKDSEEEEEDGEEEEENNDGDDGEEKEEEQNNVGEDSEEQHDEGNGDNPDIHGGMEGAEARYQRFNAKILEMESNPLYANDPEASPEPQ